MKKETKILSCSACGLMMQNELEENNIKCPRCLTTVCKKHNKTSYDLTLAIASLLLFFPAMYLPILSFQLGSQTQVGNMFFALKYFYEGGYELLSVLVFFTTILAPLIYIVISVLMFSALYEKRKPRFMKFYYKVLYELRGWVMLDIYIISVLVSIIKLEDTSEVVYGPGLWNYALLAGLSFLAINAFTPKQIWKAYHDAN
ncbi:paraquat-inducible protein A [Sulfurimonas sp. MAG313]|nr:paraquat-inducible protein A [Sulfurimonas sp. MAG313]MDF1880819.1 paraquat-inducible protein A [Sulfurimonas sp. MAG313]